MSNPAHPDETVRLASVLHRFACPEISNVTRVSFAQAFKSSGMPHNQTKAVLTDADTSRSNLSASLLSLRNTSVPADTVLRNAKEYIPLINQILLSCKVQPEAALLDNRLIFEWTSGLQKTKIFYKSEALMYDLAMTIACEALSNAAIGCEKCATGDFSSASRHFKATAGVLKFLAEDQLPKWVAKGSSLKDESLPCEATIGASESFSILFVGAAQQMAVATVLAKPGTPNYTLVSKLCLGIVEQLNLFMSSIRSKGAHLMSRIDDVLFTLVAFQISVQTALSNYFLARNYWESSDYGIALAFLKESINGMKTRSSSASKGLPPLKSTPLHVLQNDVDAFKNHLSTIMKNWERDNSLVYFEAVPKIIPEAKRLAKGIVMIKLEEYHLADVDPFPLGVKMPDISSDERMARILQEQLNLGRE